MTLQSHDPPAIITPRELSSQVSQIVRTGILTNVREELQAHLPEYVQPFVVGGYLRDRLLFANRQVKDVDVMVFNSESDAILEEWLSPFLRRKTTFGGLELEIGGISVDLWRAEQQAMVSGDKVRNIDPAKGFEYITLTINSIASSFDGQDVYGSDFLRSVVDSTLRLGRQSKWIPRWRPYHLAHLAYTHSLTSYSIGDRAAYEVLRTSNRDRTVAIKYLRDRKEKSNAYEIVWSTIESARRSLRQIPLHSGPTSSMNTVRGHADEIQPV